MEFAHKLTNPIKIPPTCLPAPLKTRKLQFKILVDKERYHKYVLGENCNGAYCAPNIHSPAHETLTGIWPIIQYIPVKDWVGKEKKKKFMFIKPYRKIKEGSLIHISAVERFESGYYCPKNIDLGSPQYYEVERNKNLTNCSN